MQILAQALFVAVLLFIAGLSGFVIERYLSRIKIPSIIAYIVVGIAIGPYALSIQDAILQGNGSVTVSALSSIALGFLIVTSFSGIHAADGRFHLPTCAVLIASSAFGFFVALIGSEALLTFAPGLASGVPGSGEHSASLLIVALAAIVTSVPFLTKIFIDLRLMGGVFASTVLISACILDIGIWVIYPVAEVLRSQGEVAPSTLIGKAAITGVCALLLFLVLSMLRRGFEGSRLGSASVNSTVFIVLITTLAALLTEHLLGAGLLLGLLLAGLVLSQGKIVSSGGMLPLGKLARWVFIPLYFILVGAGLRLDQSISALDVFVFFVWSSAIKVACVALTHFLVSRKPTTAIISGVVFNTRGGPGLVLATVAYSMDLINVSAFTAFVAATIITAPITELVLRFHLRRHIDSDLLARVPVGARIAKTR